MRKLSGILLWWVNIPLYCLVLGPGLNKEQPFIPESFMLLAKIFGIILIVIGILSTVFFLVPRMRAGAPGYDAENLQIKGVFAYVRHPQLASAWFISIGFSFWMGGIYAIITTFGFLLVLRVHASMEEKFLLIPVFKDSYLEYRKKVKAFVPFIF